MLRAWGAEGGAAQSSQVLPSCLIFISSAASGDPGSTKPGMVLSGTAGAGAAAPQAPETELWVFSSASERWKEEARVTKRKLS